MFDAVCPSISPFLTVDFHMNKQDDWNLENPREFIQSQLVTFAISGESRSARCAAKSFSILNRLISLPIFHVWWTYLVNHTGFLHPLHSVRFNFCASRESTEHPVAGRSRRLLSDPSTKMSFSDAKTLLTLQKSNLYLQQETKIIKSEERRANDPNSGAISTDCSTTSSHRN